MSKQRNKRNTRRGRAGRWERGAGSVWFTRRPLLAYVQRTAEVRNPLRPNETSRDIERRDGRWYAFIVVRGRAAVRLGFSSKAGAIRAVEAFARLHRAEGVAA